MFFRSTTAVPGLLSLINSVLAKRYEILIVNGEKSVLQKPWRTSLSGKRKAENSGGGEYLSYYHKYK
jgi:hypothetical protein